MVGKAHDQGADFHSRHAFTKSHDLAGEIAAEFTVSWPAVSQHLRVLKEAGLVTERREGTRRLYRARPEGLDDVRAFLDEFWDDKLERLKREVERG